MDFFSLFNLFNSFKGCSGLNCFISKSFKFTLGANLIISSYIRQNRINPLLYPWYGQPCTSYPSKLCKQNHNENDWFYPVILSDIFTPLRWGLQNSFGFLIRVQKRDLFFKYPNIHDFFHWKTVRHEHYPLPYHTLLKVHTQPMKDCLSGFHYSNIGF